MALEKKLRVLCIAPYENLRALMEAVAGELPQLEITAYVGDLDAGLEIALRDFHNNYDAVVSRGGTAAMLQRRIDLPVVEIPVTAVDIARAMRLAQGISKPYVLVGHQKILAKAAEIQALFHISLETYPVVTPQDARQQLAQLENQECTILCDMVAYTTAQGMEMESILVTSGEEDIREAFQQVIRICDNARRLQEENQFLRSLVWNQVHHTVVFTKEGQLFFSTIPDDSSPILAFLREVTLDRDQGQDHFLKQLHNVVYNIRRRQAQLGEKEYTTFYILESRVPGSSAKLGIRYLDLADSEALYRESFYCVTNLMRRFQEEVQRVNASSQPLMVCGEVGTCAEQVVCYLYGASGLRKYPLVIVDCSLMEEKSWNFLLNHHNSPLAKDGSTLFFQEVDSLMPRQRKQLITYLRTMEAVKRNRVIFSCVCPPEQLISEAGLEFTERLECLTLYLPPLRQRAGQMASLVTYYLNYLNTKLVRQTLGADEQAVELLARHSWPQNYSQFKRVLQELALSCPGASITAKDVQALLSRETDLLAGAASAGQGSQGIDLHMTMNELNKEIIRRVMQEERGNQTATAARLGIGRTTLWRILNSK